MSHTTIMLDSIPGILSMNKLVIKSVTFSAATGTKMNQRLEMNHYLRYLSTHTLIPIETQDV